MLKIHTIILNLLFPEKCIDCHKSGDILCRNCLIKIPSSSEDDEILSAVSYKNEAAKKVIWLLKYRGVKKLSIPLAEILHERVLEDLSELDIFSNLNEFLIIPIPLSKRRLKERGFNQSELIAREFAKKVSKTD